MIRLIIRESDSGAAANVGGPVNLSYRTYELEAPDLENQIRPNGNIYYHVEIIGAEIV